MVFRYHHTFIVFIVLLYVHSCIFLPLRLAPIVNRVRLSSLRRLLWRLGLAAELFMSDSSGLRGPKTPRAAKKDTAELRRMGFSAASFKRIVPETLTLSPKP